MLDCLRRGEGFLLVSSSFALSLFSHTSLEARLSVLCAGPFQICQNQEFDIKNTVYDVSENEFISSARF